MGLRIRDKAFECLKQSPDRRFTAREIAEWVLENYEAECRKKQAKSQASVIPLDSDEALVQQLVSEIGAHTVHIKKKYPKVKTIESRPRKFYYTEATDDEEIQQVESEQTSVTVKPVDNNEKKTIGEHDLYQKLSDYLFSEDPTVYTKRIDEKRSKNSRGAGGNKWLYPDVVGIEVLSKDWDPKILECVESHGDKTLRFWSFEVKLIINKSNVRECFLQAVTNSSWANFGYLVASEIREDAMSELRILSNSHGIGFILLNADNYLESQILIPAKERTKIDWNTANRLIEENDDFEEYIEQIIDFYRTDKIRENEWDGREVD